MKLTKLEIDLILESISYHQLHLQKIYKQSKNQEMKNIIFKKHKKLVHLTALLIKELDNYDD